MDALLISTLVRSHLRDFTSGVLFGALVLSPSAFAGPTGGNIVGGSGHINHANLTTTINQNSQRLAIDWATFNLRSNETVNFNQPNRNAITLNRILDINPSQINGAINANGQIILANPNGILFGKNASVNVGGLFAAALSVNPQDFMAGRLNFKALEGSKGIIANEGTLKVIDGGTLVLLAQQIKNEGLLIANFGNIALATGNDITVQFDEQEHFNIRINQNTLADILDLDNPQILNSGIIQAHGGNVVLTTRQASAIRASVTRRDESRVFSFSQGTVVAKDGGIYLGGPGGDISNTGEVNVNNNNGEAGTVVFDMRNLNHSGKVYADSYTDSGGSIKLIAADTIMLSENSTLSAQAYTGAHQQGQGGTVHVLGNKVGMIDQAHINASGAEGGGEVLIGGDYQGNNPDIQNAEAVYLGKDTQIKTDATQDGDGGKLIVWSDKATRAYGKLSAKGKGTGKGGFIETSSKQYVDLQTEVDVSAESGLSGEWLIDPSNITISNAFSDDIDGLPNGPNFTSSSGQNNSNLDIFDLRNSLSTGANITITTATFTSCNPMPCTPVDQQVEPSGGNISLDTPLNLDFLNGGDGNVSGLSSLTLNADHDININANITETGSDDFLNLTLNADNNDNAAGGRVNIANGISLNLSGGNLAVTGNGFTNNGTITTENTANPGTEPNGDITINVSGSAALGDLSTDADGGNLIVNAASVSGGVVSVAGTTAITASGNVTLNNAGNTFSNTVTISNGNTVALNSSSNLNLGNVNAGSLTASSNAAVTQTSGTTLSTTGNATLTSNGGNTTLGGTTVGGNLIANASNAVIQTTGTNIGTTGNTTLTSSNGNSTLHNITTTDLTVNANAIDQQAGTTLNVSGNALLTSSAGNITLGETSVNGNLTANASNAVIQTATTSINNATGNTVLTSSNGNSTLHNISTIDLTVNANAIDQQASTALSVSGTSDFTSAADITLTNTNNNLGTSIQLNATNNATIVNNAAVNLGTSAVGGNLDVTANGDINDVPAQTIQVTGNTTFLAPTGNDITLDNAGHQFGNLVSNTITFLTQGAPGNLNNITVRDNSSSGLILQSPLSLDGNLDLQAQSLSLGNTTLTNNTASLTLTSTNGSLTQSNVISHAGSTVLSATGGDITLDQVNNLADVQVINAGNTTTLNNGINAINLDGVSADNLTVTATGGITDSNSIVVSDTTTLDAGSANIVLDTNSNDVNNVQITNANQVELTDQNSINLAGAMNTLDVTAGLDNTPASIANVANNTLAVTGASSFALTNGGDLNLSNGAQSNLQGVVSINTTAGNITDVTLDNSATLQLAALNVSNAGAGTLTLNSTNDINQSGAISVDGTTTLQANNISLNSNNDFNNVTINDSNTVQLTDSNGGINIVANNTNASNTIDLDLNTTGNIQIEGELLNADLSSSAGNIQSSNTLTVANNTTLDAVGNVDFQSNPVDLSNVLITQANNALMNDNNGINITDANVSGILDIDATDTVAVNGTVNTLDINTQNTINVSGTVNTLTATTTGGNIQNNNSQIISVSGATTLDAGNSDILLSQANDFNTLSITNARDAFISDTNNLQLQNINVRDVALQTQGDLTQAAGTQVVSTRDADLNSGNGSITLTENNQFTNLSLNGSNASVVNDQALVLNDSGVVDAISVTTHNGNLSINQISGNTLALTAADALVDANGNSNNIQANKATLTAANGIGMNSDIDIQVARLEAHNQVSGDINIINNGGEITLEDITNQATDTGNFNFQNDNAGDVLIERIALQKNQAEDFSSGTVDLFARGGSFLGVGDEDISAPDITATNLRVVGVQGTFGTIQRPLVLDISGKVFLRMRASLNPIFVPPAPDSADIDDNSIFQFTTGSVLAAVNGVQVTEVETLLDISPAIFTDIRNFVAAEEPVLLPRDQRFEDGYTVDDDDEYFEQAGNTSHTQ